MAGYYEVKPFNFNVDYGKFDVGEAIKQGIENRNLPNKLAADLLATQLQNKINAPKAENAARDEEQSYKKSLADIDWTRTNTDRERATLPYAADKAKYELENLKHPQLTGETAQLYRLRDSYAPGSKDYNDVQQRISTLAAGSSGPSFTIDPKSGAISYSSGGSGNRGGGQQVVTNADGTSTVVQKPTNNMQTALEKAQTANKARNELNAMIKHDYIGSKANFHTLADLATYNTTRDPAKKKAAGDRLVKAIAAVKLEPEVEAVQLLSQGVPATVHALNKQAKSLKLGWPADLETVLANVPKELSDRGVDEHNVKLERVNQIRALFSASGFPIDLPNNNAPTQVPSAFDGLKSVAHSSNGLSSKSPTLPGTVRVYFKNQKGGEDEYIIPKDKLSAALKDGARQDISNGK